MKGITPLLSVLILGSMSVLGLSEHPSNELAREAVCMVKCQNSEAQGECRRLCNSDPGQIPILDDEAEANAEFVCQLDSQLALDSDFGVFIVEIRNQTGDWKHLHTTDIDIKEVYSLGQRLPPGRYQIRFTRVFAEGISRSKIQGFTISEPNENTTKVLDIWVQCLTYEMEWGSLQLSLTAQIGYKHIVEDPDCKYLLVCDQDNGSYSARSFIFVRKVLQSKQIFRNLPFGQNFTITVRTLEDKPKIIHSNTLKFSTPLHWFPGESSRKCVPSETEDLQVVVIHKKMNTYDVRVTWHKPHHILDFFIVSITSNSGDFDESPVTPHKVSGTATETIFRDVNISQHFNVSIRGWSTLLGGGPVTSKSFTVPDEIVDLSVSGSYTIIVTAVLISATLLVVIGVCIYYLNCRKGRRGQRRVKSSQKNKGEIDPNRLTITRVLGNGAFGVVKFGRLREDTGQVIDVAVKMLRDDNNETELRNFRLEIEMMKSLGKHPNIVSFVGYRTSGLYPFLVVEYCPRGDLLTFLRATSLETKTTAVDEKDERYVSAPGLCARDTTPKENSEGSEGEDTYIDTAVANQGPTVTVLNMLNFGRQIAAGMEFLSSKRIVHRDLAARNILVCDKGVVKISDFGMSRDIYQENVYRKTGNGRMPFKWMAIESLIHQVYTTQSDVWSFGILLWEIFTLGNTPYPEIPTLGLLNVLQSGYRMERPEYCTQALYEVMLSCWKLKPKDRPTFILLRKQLDQLIGMTAEHQYLDADYIFAGMQLEEDSQTSSPRDTPIPPQKSLAVNLDPEIIHEDVEIPCTKTEVCVEV